MPKFLRTALLALTFFLPSSFSQADDLKGCFEDWPPYMHRSSNGQDLGPVITIFKKLAEKTGQSFQLTNIPYAQCLDSVTQGQHDFILGVSGEHDGILNTDLPVVFWNLVALVRNDSSHQSYTDLSQFNDHIVLQESTFEYPEVIARWIIDNNIKIKDFKYVDASAASNRQPFEILKSQQADVFFEDFGWLKSQMDIHHPDAKILTPAVANDPDYIGFSKANADNRNLFNSALTEMFENGELANIYQNEVGFDYMAAYQQTTAQ